MNHSEALQLMATERYLLDEFPPETREQFEEHFFSCPECAIDVRMASSFIESSRKALVAAPPALVPASTASPNSGWFAWLRPAFAVPAFAVLLAVIGYQAFIVHPEMSNTIAELRKPQVLTSTYLGSGTARGDNRPVVSAPDGRPFVLFLDVPPAKNFQSYSAELLSPDGSKVWSLAIPAATVEAAKDTLAIQVAPPNGVSGEYVLVLRGLSAGQAEGSEIERYPFELKSR
jgi:hypothetical protein